MPANWWIVSAPGKGNASSIVRSTESICMSEDSAAYDFKIPELRVKNLSSLMNLTDDMQKYEERTESMLKRLHRNYEELPSEVKLSVGQDNVPPEVYLQQFQWQNTKFPKQKELATMAGDIFNEITDMDNDIKSKQAELAAVNSRLNAIQRKRSGNLQTRDLSDLITTNHYLNDPQTKKLSEKIVPYFFVVSVHKKDEFLNSYERFTNFVVPGSAKQIPAEDKDYLLYRVLHLNAPTMEDDLKKACEDTKVATFRKFEFNNMAQAVESTEDEKVLVAQQRTLTANLITLIKSLFSEMFVDYMHLKAIRVFVESVLWYSFPLDYAIMLVRPNESTEQSLRAKLADKFRGSKCSQVASNDDDDNHPYVSMDLELGWLLGEE